MTEADRIVHYRNVFHGFARVEAPGLDSPMYAELAYGVSLDDELLALAALKRRGQPAPNMLFAAAQYLLLCGVAHPLAAHYPIIAGTPRPPVPAFPLFRDFCLSHRGRIAELLRVRRTQTNEVRRCACLLPALALVAREASAPLALFDVGASAGLNLNFDRYAYRYRCPGGETLRWGEQDAPVRIDAELRGAGAIPPLPPAIEVASRDGIDLHPVDVQDADQLLWLRALIWPEHEDRHQRLLDAATVLQRSPVRLHTGDAADVLPALLKVVPPEHAVVVYSTITLYQFSPEQRHRLKDVLRAASLVRAVWQIALEGDGTPTLSITRHRHGEASTTALAKASPHGWWMAW